MGKNAKIVRKNNAKILRKNNAKFYKDMEQNSAKKYRNSKFSEYKMNILQKKVFEGFIGIYKDLRTTRRQFIDLLVSY